MSTGTSSTLSQEFVDQLSAELIIEPDAQYVFAQLAGAARAGAMGIPDILGGSGAGANMQNAMGGAMGTLKLADPKWMAVAKDFAIVASEPTTPGKVILLDQPRYLGGTFTEASRALTEAVPVSGTPQAPTMGQVSLTIKEYAGPHDGSNVAPIGITDFLRRRSKHDLVQYVGTLLRRDRNRFVDTVVAALLLSTTNVTTPVDDLLLEEPDEATLTAGLRLREIHLARMLRVLQERNIPTFSNGMYMLTVSPKHVEDLRQDKSFRESVRYLGEQGALVSGHIANHGGFMVVMSSNIPTKAVGDGGGVTGHQGVAFGPHAIGWAIGLEAEARRDKNDDFGREDRMLWIAHEAWKLLDADFVQRFVTT